MLEPEGSWIAAIVMAIQLCIEGQEAGEVALLGIDGPFRLPRHLRPELLLRQDYQPRLGIPLRNRKNVMLKIICRDQRFPWGHLPTSRVVIYNIRAVLL